MVNVSFVDMGGMPIIGVIAFRNGVAVAADNGAGSIDIDEGLYTFKMIGFEDLEHNVTVDAQLVMKNDSYLYDAITVTDVYSPQTWSIALLLVVLGIAISKIRS
jgi:hypothetical protein